MWRVELYVSCMAKLITYAFFITLLCALSGCGGGDEEEDQKDTQPVDCKAQPELCR